MSAINGMLKISIDELNKQMSRLGVSKVETMTEDELKAKARDIQRQMDMKAAMKEARSSYKAQS